MNNLKKIRLLKNESVENLAKLLNVKEQQIYRIENYKSFMTEDKIILLCKHFNITADLLLGLTNKIEL